MRISHNLKGESMRLWIADAKKYPSYESLKTAYGNQVYGHYSSKDSNGWLSTFYWSYRDWSTAYQTNIVHGYWDSYSNPINDENEKLLLLEVRLEWS